MSHYDTLGVARDATLDEIKRGYRKASSAAHPDRPGGSDDLMAKVNAAYDVLSDVDRRKRYDATGDDGKIETLDGAAQDLLLKILQQVIEVDADPIALGRMAIAKNLERTERDRADVHTKIARLEARRATVVARDGPNLFQGLIDQQLDNLRQQLTQMDHFAKTLERARERLDLHEYQEPDAFAEAGNSAWSDALNATHYRRA